MKVEKKSTTITISIDKGVKAQIEKYASELDLNLSRLTKNLMYEAFRHFQLFDKIRLSNQMLITKADNFRNLITTYSDQIQEEVGDFSSEPEGKVQVSIIIDLDVKNLMSEYATNLDIPLKQFAANMLYIGLNDFKLLNNLGIIRLAIAFEKFVQSFESFKPHK